MHNSSGQCNHILTIVSCILCIHLFITEFTKYVVLFLDLTKRIGASEGVIMCSSFDGVRKLSTLTMNQESADATETGNVLAFLTTGLTSELDLRRMGTNVCWWQSSALILQREAHLMSRSKLHKGTTVKEGSAAIFATSITITYILDGFLSEKKGVLWVHGVVYHVG
jgi:hypothetical protein